MVYIIDLQNFLVAADIPEGSQPVQHYKLDIVVTLLHNKINIALGSRLHNAHTHTHTHTHTHR